jgi:hypothetical protein
LVKKSSNKNDVNSIFEKFSKYLEEELGYLTKTNRLSEIKQIIKDRFKSNFKVNENEVKKILTLIIFSLILLCKENYIKKDDFKDMRSFISDFFYSYFPILNKDTLEDTFNIDIKYDNRLFEIFKESLGILDQDIWKKILIDSVPEIKIFFWDSLDNEKDRFKALDVIGEMSGNKNAKLIPKKKNYDLYLNELNADLQRQEHKFDLVLIDAIHFSDYKEKGVFESINSYFNEDSESRLKEIKDIYKEMIGFAYNGNFEAVPLTRNFHLPACSELYSATRGLKDFKSNLNEIILQDLFEKDDIKKMRESWENLNQLETTELIDYFTDPASSETQTLCYTFINFMGENTSFLPMQAAKSAHVVYTAFAYFAGGAPGPNTSFINIEKDINNTFHITLWDEKDLTLPVLNFFKCIYSFVPIISLCTDHRIAAQLRKWKDTLWFDPCLPIEAEKFDPPNQKISFGEIPSKGCRNYFLSCIGGYCLALLSRSKFKGEAAQIAVRFSEQYFSSAESGDATRREINNRIRFNKSQITDDNFKRKYLEFNSFENIARRPSFPGWRIIEEIISNELRLFIATILIYRSIVGEFSAIKVLVDNKNDMNVEKINSFLKKCSCFIDIDNESEKDAFINDVNPERYFIQEQLKEKHIIDYIEKITKIIKDWSKGQHENPQTVKTESKRKEIIEEIKEDEELIQANFDCILTDSLYILSLLRFSISSYEKNNHRNKKHDLVLDVLTKRFIKNLKGKLKGACLAFGWKFS